MIGLRLLFAEVLADGRVVNSSEGLVPVERKVSCARDNRKRDGGFCIANATVASESQARRWLLSRECDGIG